MTRARHSLPLAPLAVGLLASWQDAPVGSLAGGASVVVRTGAVQTAQGLPGGANLPPGALAFSPSGCAPPGWTATFGAEPGTSGPVADLVVHDDGRGPALVAGGAFTAAGGFGAANVARWDGSRWSELGGGLPWEVHDLLVADFGGGQPPVLFAAGAGEQGVGGSIARLSGSAWLTFSLPNGVVRSLAVFDDGSGPKLYAAGEFTDLGAHVARWNGTGFVAVGAGTNGDVEELLVHDDGSGPRLYAAGSFTSAGGQPASRIARWDGAQWTPLGSGMNAEVLALAVFDDGHGPRLVAGGRFTAAGGTPANRIARWDGAGWTALGSGMNGDVTTLGALDDGSGGGAVLFAGGSFTAADGLPAQLLARWNGASWLALAGGIQAGQVNALIAHDDGGGRGLFVGGDFQSAGNLPAHHIARWRQGAWAAFNPKGSLQADVHELAVFDDGNGPALHAAWGRTANFGLVRWRGASATEIATGTNGEIDALAVFDDGSGAELVAAGNFTRLGGVDANRIARWDGAAWRPLASGLNGPVLDLIVHDDGSGPRLYAGGEFTSAGGVSASRVARWDGVAWQALPGSVSVRVKRFALHDAGFGAGPELYAAGGRFNNADGSTANNLARWDGTRWQGLGVPISVIDALVSHDDGSGPQLYVGGEFGNLHHIVRWDGLSWGPVGEGRPSPVRTLAVYDDGGGPQLYAGTRGLLGDPVQNRMSRWDGTRWSGLGSEMDDAVEALAVYDAGQGAALFAGGSFEGSRAGDSFLARWQGCPDLDAPVLACVPVVVVDHFGGLGEVVEFSLGIEDRDPHVQLVLTPPSGSHFPPGTTLVNGTATDGSGNTASCEFPVVVQPKARRR